MIFGPKPYTPPACARDDCTNAVAWQLQIRQHDVTSIGAYYCDADLPDRLRRLLDHEGDHRAARPACPATRQHYRMESSSMTTATQPLELFDDGPADLQELLSRAGRDLHRALHASYLDGFERDLANYLLGYHLPHEDDQHLQAVDAALTELVHERLQQLVTVDCLLRETEESSYDTVTAMADTLLAAIRTQGRQSVALYELVLDEIVKRSRCACVDHDQAIRSTCGGCGTQATACSWSQNPALGRGDCCADCNHG